MDRAPRISLQSHFHLFLFTIYRCARVEPRCRVHMYAHTLLRPTTDHCPHIALTKLVLALDLRLCFFNLLLLLLHSSLRCFSSPCIRAYLHFSFRERGGARERERETPRVAAHIFFVFSFLFFLSFVRMYIHLYLLLCILRVFVFVFVRDVHIQPVFSVHCFCFLFNR